ncbi:chromate resistance protein [Azoarcus sp. DD4]|uniref:chromate resistance protein ChrB domain-containing protein n=1 Tax=Azoarcus sp. DD4 TaxID=2027405 RepID=UPI001127103D|nr:chromate resistance protein ChrB domain-containing protein [Azoarcus sp. DD4]QDF98387.1 chromate resistance protein [Azoarcus sp. DD4]
MIWLTLILSLPSDNANARMRAWRALRACGAAVLRDGVYLLPQRDATRDTLTRIADEVREQGGSAHLLSCEGDSDFAPLFDRSAEYGTLLGEIAACRAALTTASAGDGPRQLRKLRKSLDQLAAIDFFPGEARRQAEAALAELDAELQRALSPGEPHAAAGTIPRLALAEYRGRSWATRARPWVDRLACAWLIRRDIDPDARFLWLDDPADCPPDALGFDFDGAAFSHVGARVSFETLLASFALESPALLRVGALVHFLDVGGVQPPEASGVERVLAGLRATLDDDNHLCAAAAVVFDGLVAAFETDAS